MPSYECAIEAICEKCEKTFRINMTIFNSLNLDFSSSYSDNLLNNKLNRVTCPHCNVEFTYERPFIAYSMNNKFAIMADFHCTNTVSSFGRKYIFDLFKIDGMKFRIVNYLCEVSEKVRIFNAKLDDIKVEQLKVKHFGNEYFNDKSNKILLFKEICDNELVFHLYNDLDEVLDTFKIPYSEYEKCDYGFKCDYETNGFINWYKIDDIYIKENSNE